MLDSLKKNKAVYMAAVGGAAALIARSIKKAEVIAYEDLGPEAIRKLEVEDFPVIVVNDCHGNDLYSRRVSRHIGKKLHRSFKRSLDIRGMKIKLQNENIASAFVAHIEKVSGEVASRCYQCGNCTGGCPVSFKMDYGPSQIIRMLQIGQEEEVQEANSMWICVGCMQCFSRCPQSVSAANIFEAFGRLRSGTARTIRR